MEDSYIISNFHSLCRLCLHKSELMVSIYSPPPDEDTNLTITSKITDCFELQMHPNDGLPGKICYKCLYEINKCSKFRVQCIQNETRLRKISSRGGELDHSTSSELSNCTQEPNLKLKQESYVMEDSVVMVVDPSMDYDSSEESAEEPTADNINDREPIQENFLKDIAMCQYCDQAFVSQEKCSEHELAYHDPNLPYSCVECSLVFSERSQHVQHTRHVHHNNKPYQCPQCEKGFGRRSDLRKHAIVHTGIRPYQCHYCMKNFSRNTNLSKHLRIHAGEKPHVCPLCPRSFVCNGDLQRHLLIHSGTKPYACRKCPQTFSRRDKLVKHQMKHGPNSPDLGLPESEADQETHDMVVNINPFSDLLSSPTQLNADQNNEYDLPRVPDHIAGVGSFLNQQHLQKKPSTSVKPVNTSPPKTKPISNKNKPKNIKCHQCPKRFSSLDAYKTHVSVAHIGSRGFLCKICFKKFSRRRDLDRHAAIHNRPAEFSCSQCDMKFTQKDLLDKHEETHESLVTNLPCIECGATFEKKAELVAHIKSHFVDDFEERSPEDEPKKEFSAVNSFFDLET